MKLNRKEIMTLRICAMILVGLTIFYSIHLVSADLGTFKTGSCVPIRVLANCTNINLTEVSSNNQTFVIYSPMTNLGGQTFNYTFCNTTSLGVYTFSWNNPCVDCSTSNCGNSFLITVTGSTLDTSKSISYIIIFIVSFLIFLGLLFLGIMLPSKNDTDEMTGYIIKVSNLKYFKLLCLGFSYLALVFLFYLSWMFSYAYLDFTFLTTILQFIFYILAWLIVILFPVTIYLLISNWVKDSKLDDMLSRGLTVDGK